MSIFEVVNLKSSNEKMRNQLPQYRYATELMNETNKEKVFQMLLNQPVTLKLGEVLGTSYDLGKCFQATMHSPGFQAYEATTANIQILQSFVSKQEDSDANEEDEITDEMAEVLRFEACPAETGVA